MSTRSVLNFSVSTRNDLKYKNCFGIIINFTIQPTHYSEPNTFFEYDAYFINKRHVYIDKFNTEL